MSLVPGPVVRQKKTYATKDQSHVNEVAFVDGWWEMCESIRELELVHAPGLTQLDISSAQIFIHIAEEESSRLATWWSDKFF